MDEGGTTREERLVGEKAAAAVSHRGGDGRRATARRVGESPLLFRAGSATLSPP